VTLDDGRGDVTEFAAVVLGMVAEHRERLVGADRLAGIRTPFACSIRARRPNASSRLWYSVKRCKSYVDRALQLSRGALDDVREHTTLRRLVDVCGACVAMRSLKSSGGRIELCLFVVIGEMTNASAVPRW
jgi:hypothetical protein